MFLSTFRIGDAEVNGAELTKKKSGVEEKKSPDSKAPPIPKNAKRIVFKFVMDKIQAGLYTGQRAIESNKGNVERNIKDAFASMKLQGLLVTGFMSEDNGMDVAITLDTFSMSDEREGKNTIKQLLDKKPGKHNADQKFVQLKFNQNYRGDKDIIINSSAFFLFLSPEFLGQLASFFVAPPPPEAANIPPEFIAKKRFAEQQAALTATTTPSKPKTPVATPEPLPVAGGGALALRGSIQDIEIILIENALSPKNSQALILSFSAVLEGDTKDGKQKINGAVKNLQIVSTYFAEEMRHLVNYYVLNRMNIELAVEIDMLTQDQLISGKIDTVHLKVSPDVIRLLSAVSTQFSQHRIESPDTNDPKKPVISKYPNYWFKKSFNRHEYWWFSDVAEEAIEGFEPEVNILPLPKRMEKAVFSIDKFIVTLEVGTDDDTVPMILLESTLRSSASNWSSRLSCDAEMKLQISYYNERFSVWEPIIEPNIKDKRGVASWEKWNVTAKVRSPSEDEEGDDGAAAPPKMQISIDAVDVMNITVTKSLLSLLTQLSTAFEKAAKQISPPRARPLPGTSPYLILNDSGIAVKVANSDSLKVSENGDLIDATHGDFVELNIIGYQQPIGLQFSDDTQKAELCLELMSTTREINVMRAEKRAVRLPKQAPSGRQWTLVVDTNIEQSRRVVTLKSLVSFVNHTDTPLEIQSLRDTTLDLCGVVENDDEVLNVALPLLYTPTGEFFIRPANDQYDSSNESFSWHDLETKKRGIVRCNLLSDDRQCLYFDLVAIEDPVLGEIGPNKVDKQWTIHIYPPMVLRNLLPFPIKVLEPMSFTLEGGDEMPVNVVPGHKMIYTLEYEESYTARLDILEERTELDCITFVADKDANKKLHLGIHWSTQNHRLDCQLYAPFWLVNNTNKTLCYMPEYCIKHEPNNNPILLPFADKNVASKKKAKVKVGNSAWSDEFPLDTAGTAARVICPDDECQYELTVEIEVCQSGLTKVISFAPFYLCHNDSKFDMQVREPGNPQWTLVPAESVAGIWPKQKDKRKAITVKYAEFNEESIPFPFTESFDSFVPVDSEHLGVYVTSSVAESRSVVHIEPFQLGMAPAFVMNATSFNLQYGQKGSTKRGQLGPWETAPFKWEDVVGHDRKMEWKCGDHSGEDNLLRNAYGSFLPSNKKEYHYWVCFLNGRQRYFLVTDDLAVMTTAQQAYEVERMDMQAEISIQGIGISIVNNLISQEILYMGISSSGIMWEQEMKRRFKPLSVREIEALEDAYQKWIHENHPSGQHQITISGNHTSVDFDNMIFSRKGKKEVKIRRNYANGLWMLYRQSAHQKQIHLKINHIQIDNQLPACIFPTVLAVCLPPKSVIADNAPKPFTEVSITIQNSEHSNIVQYKYLHALIQEFAIRVDQGLINSMIAMFTNQQIQAPYNKEMYNKDLELAKPHFSEMVATTQATQQKAFYDDLHISPLMIHLSFSQGGTAAGVGPHDHIKKKDEKGGINIQSEFLNVLLKSVGVSLTELQDVVFKLAFFERRYVFYSNPQLQAEIQSHYTMQFVKQLYVLVLGLDIIGNPYGLVRDLSTGLEDLFYQPINGAIQGPEEFAEGLALGVSSLFGHAVGGAAGAVSRITGTLGKGVAALTLDEEYQRKRQEAMNRRPQNFGEGLSRGAKGLGQGVFDGVTGIVSKPIEGARTGGVGGFMKGVGKGLVGAVTRPVSGVVDFASSSLDAVKVTVGGGDASKALRPPRLIPRDQIVRPYSFTEAVGYKFFRDTDRGKFADTDYFVAHAVISDQCVFIATNKRVFLAKRQLGLGTWAAEWQIEYHEIASIKRTSSGLSFELKQKKKGLLGLGGTKGKVIEFKDEQIADKVATRVEQAFDQAV
uniref:Uncharacterized protein n=1 Tax=Panagrolaimus superbus TaxID=310955 RepID=A0A914YWY4_9BILA